MGCCRAQAESEAGPGEGGPGSPRPQEGGPPAWQAPQLHSAQRQEAGPTLRPWASPTLAPAAQGSSMAFPAPNAPEPLHQPPQGGAPGPRAQPPLPARHGVAAPATTRLPNTFRMPGTWPPRVTSHQGPPLPRGSDRWRVPESWGGGGWHTSRTCQRFPPRTLLQEGPGKGRPPFPQPRWVGGWGVRAGKAGAGEEHWTGSPGLGCESSPTPCALEASASPSWASLSPPGRWGWGGQGGLGPFSRVDTSASKCRAGGGYVQGHIPVWAQLRVHTDKVTHGL